MISSKDLHTPTRAHIMLKRTGNPIVSLPKTVEYIAEYSMIYLLSTYNYVWKQPYFNGK